MARTKKSAPSAPAGDQLEQKLFDLADQLEQRLLGFPPLMKIFQAVGIDPASPDAKLLITFMKVSLYYGINARLKRHPSEVRARRAVPGATKWTQSHSIALILEVTYLMQQGISEREAIKRIAAEPSDERPSPAYRFPYKRQAGLSEAGRGFSHSTPQKRYEEALWQRWHKVKKDEKAMMIAELPDMWLKALGFSPRELGEK